jgi:hypothetical protein
MQGCINRHDGFARSLEMCHRGLDADPPGKTTVRLPLLFLRLFSPFRVVGSK